MSEPRQTGYETEDVACQCGSQEFTLNEYAICRQCGENVGGDQLTVSISELRDLVEEWREESDAAGGEYDTPRAGVYETCADELEAAIGSKPEADDD